MRNKLNHDVFDVIILLHIELDNSHASQILVKLDSHAAREVIVVLHGPILLGDPQRHSKLSFNHTDFFETFIAIELIKKVFLLS